MENEAEKMRLELRQLLADCYETEAPIDEWMKRPRKAFGGKSADELLEQGETDLIGSMIAALRGDVFL